MVTTTSDALRHMIGHLLRLLKSTVMPHDPALRETLRRRVALGTLHEVVTRTIAGSE